jgi:hypothetical protein
MDHELLASTVSAQDREEREESEMEMARSSLIMSL